MLSPGIRSQPSRAQGSRSASGRELESGSLQQRLLPCGWLDVVRQVLIFAAAYVGYSIVRAFAEAHGSLAFDHAYEIVGLERSLHLFVEPQIQAWAMGSHLLIAVVSWIYVNAQSTLAVAALAYIYLRRHESYRRVRDRLVIAMGIALIGYALFPTAPPRFLPEWGFVDTVANTTGVTGAHANASMTGLVNPYAAVPSMHVAVASLLGFELAKVSRARAARILWRLYPVAIAFVVIVTANHFVFDVATGAMTAALSAYLAARLAPLAWRLRSLYAPAQASG
ncbi:MAG: phosphatase PAP2 family protein [Solirubrobacteraceae bacterium]